MHWRSIALGGWGLVIVSCLPAVARTHNEHQAHGGNCVAYARELTGIRLDGNAASWWPHAEGRYERGDTPKVGAILVFKPYGRMRVGHVAVVSQILRAREVLVDQANWVRGRVSKAISVIDASPLNDWTSVKVQFGGTHGRENPTYGFIYPHTIAPTAIAAASHDKPRVAEPDRHREKTRERQFAARAKQRDAPKAADKATPDVAAKTPHRLAKAETPHHRPKGTDAKFADLY